MKIVKVNKSRSVGKRGNKGTTDYRTYESKMMVDLGEIDMSKIFGVSRLDDETSQKYQGIKITESVESLDVERELTDYLNQKLNGQISYQLDWNDDKIKEYEMETGVKIDKERRFGNRELVVFRINRKDKHNDGIDMEEHLGIKV